ncbi:MAG: hypothetical protein HYZ42_02075 [Bacteroidetes bacterium]|nr:hypothetical protein [Bacteroidota bacterium]
MKAHYAILLLLLGIACPSFSQKTITIGFYNVENLFDTIDNKVDLIAMPLLKPENYNIVHYESPDERGIDVALIFKSKTFKLIDSKSYRIKFTGDAKDRTRDILLVALQKDKKDTLYFIVNHFPSRSGGQEISEPKRIEVAKKVREIYDSLLQINYQSKVVVMGDFNDEPGDVSIKDGLHCKFKKNEMNWNDLYNPMMDLKDL